MGYYPIMVDPLTHSSKLDPFKAVALLGHSAETTYRYTNQKHEDPNVLLFGTQVVLLLILEKNLIKIQMNIQ